MTHEFRVTHRAKMKGLLPSGGGGGGYAPVLPRRCGTASGPQTEGLHPRHQPIGQPGHKADTDRRRHGALPDTVEMPEKTRLFYHVCGGPARLPGDGIRPLSIRLIAG